MQMMTHRRWLFGLPAIVIAAALVLIVGVRTTHGQTFTVTNTNDSGAGSLRAAIESANNTAGADTISFNIPGSGVKVISPTTPLPSITDAGTIDGTTQPGATCAPRNLLIQIDGASLGSGGSGLSVQNGVSVLRGLSVVRFSDTGIAIGTGGAGSFITCNHIGVDAAGTTAAPNDTGIFLFHVTGVQIGGVSAGARNVISGNTLRGLWITGNSAPGNLVINNVIGTNLAGTSAIPNQGAGVHVEEADNNFIGTAQFNGGNVISGNNSVGVVITGSGATDNRVYNNRIGTNDAGTADLGNDGDGVVIDSAPGNFIGGIDGGMENVISGNSGSGISIYGTGANGNTLQGNAIGTNISGGAAIANDVHGIYIGDGNNDTIIGGTGPGDGNIISGNGANGIMLNGNSETGTVVDGTIIQGNHIGINYAGNAAVPNRYHGVEIYRGTNTLIGGTASGAGNLIGGNGDSNPNGYGSGIAIGSPASQSNVVEGNTIGLAIDGNTRLANQHQGITIFDGAHNNRIGGTASGAGNVISGNRFDGVGMYNGAHDNAVEGNTIGLNAARTAAQGNGWGGGHGVGIYDASDNHIGGAASGAGNVIGGNGSVGNFGSGIGIGGSPQSSGNLVLGNWIGLTPSSAQFGNAYEGVAVYGSAHDSLIGGTATGQANVIAYNGLGVYIDGTSINNAIRANRVFNNGDDVEINLAPYSPNPNDAGDGDTGANLGQNYPTISAARLDASNARLLIALNSTANATFAIDLFGSTSCAGAEYYLGTVSVTTNGAGNGSAQFDTPLGLQIANVLATATDAAGNTSELSPCAETNLLRNVDFAAGSPIPTDWTLYAVNNDGSVNVNHVNYRTQSGVFEFYRVTGSFQAVITQSTGIGFPPNTRLRAGVQLGNSSAQRKRALVIVHDADFSDLQICNFWLAPGQPLTSYTLQFVNSDTWTNATLSIYDSNPVTSLGWLRVDNASLTVTLSAFNDDQTLVTCTDPTAPGAGSGANGPNLIANGGFTAWNPQSVGNWTTFGSIVHNSATGGVFGMYRRPDQTPGEGVGVVFQNTPTTTIAANTPLYATFQLGNSTAVRQRVMVLLHNRNFNDLTACTFWLAPNTVLQNYYMSAYSTLAWSQGASLSIYASTRNATDPGGRTLVDNVQLYTTPSQARTGTTCGQSVGSLTADTFAESDLLVPTLIPTAASVDPAGETPIEIAPPMPTAIAEDLPPEGDAGGVMPEVPTEGK